MTPNFTNATLIVLFVLSSCATEVFAGSLPNEVLQSAAPMWGIDARNSWQSPYLIPSAKPQIEWQTTGFNWGSPTPSALTVDVDGHLYVPAQGEHFRRFIGTGLPDISLDPFTVSRDSTLAHSAAGHTFLWRSGSFQSRETQTAVLNWSGVAAGVSDGIPPKIGPDGTVYAPSIAGEVFAYSPSGQLTYRSNAYGTDTYSGMIPAVDSNSNIYFSSGYELVSLDPLGHERWKKQIQTFGPVLLAPNNVLYHVIRYTGEFVGRNINTGEIVQSFSGLTDFTLKAISDQGIMYLSTPFVGIRAFALDGTEVWRYDRQAINSLVVDAAGKVLATDELGNLIALSTQGQKLWETKYGTFSVSENPLILSQGRIVVHQRNELMLFQTPEPHSIAQFITALLGLIASRRTVARVG